MNGAPPPIWETRYRTDGGARHRCRRCNNLLFNGARIVATATTAGAAVAVHHDCADRIALFTPETPDGRDWTWRDLLRHYGEERLRDLGWDIPVGLAVHVDRPRLGLRPEIRAGYGQLIP